MVSVALTLLSGLCYWREEKHASMLFFSVLVKLLNYSKRKQIAQTYFNVMTTLQVHNPVSRLFSPDILIHFAYQEVNALCTTL